MMQLPNQFIISLIYLTKKRNCLTNINFTKTRKKLNMLVRQTESILGNNLNAKGNELIHKHAMKMVKESIESF